MAEFSNLDKLGELVINLTGLSGYYSAGQPKQGGGASL
jgi:hypothetical protein